MANPGNVAGGLKATLANPKVSDEAKQNAQERLDNEDFPSTSEAAARDSAKNPGNVIGGLKATTKNPNVSDEAKQNAQERLDNEFSDA